MEKKQRIQNLLDRLDVLEGRSSKKTRIRGLLSRLNDLIQEKTERQKRKNEVISIVDRHPKIRSILSDLDRISKTDASRLEEVSDNFHAEVTKLREELLSTQKHTVETTDAQTDLLGRRVRELEASFAERLGSFERFDTALASEIDSIRDALKAIDVPDVSEIQKTIEEFEKQLKGLERRVLSKLGTLQDSGGGNMNRSIIVGGNTDTLGKFTDINLKAGANTSITYTANQITGYTDITIAATDADTGIVRSVNSIAVSTAAGAVAGTDYVYVCTGAITLTLPTASGNSNLYTIKNVGSGTVTIARTGADTIDNDASLGLTMQFTSVDLISDGVSNWNIT